MAAASNIAMATSISAPDVNGTSRHIRISAAIHIIAVGIRTFPSKKEVVTADQNCSTHDNDRTPNGTVRRAVHGAWRPGLSRILKHIRVNGRAAKLKSFNLLWKPGLEFFSAPS